MGDTGKTFAFDHRATGGFGRGEGAGVVILKPLEQAIKDNDIVRAVIVNSGINSGSSAAFNLVKFSILTSLQMDGLTASRCRMAKPKKP